MNFKHSLIMFLLLFSFLFSFSALADKSGSLMAGAAKVIITPKEKKHDQRMFEIH